MFEAVIKDRTGREFKDSVRANDQYEARRILQGRHGDRAVPYLPKIIPA